MNYSRYIVNPQSSFKGIADVTSDPIPWLDTAFQSYVVTHRSDYVGDKPGVCSSMCEFGHTYDTAWRFDNLDAARVVGSACAEMAGYDTFTVFAVFTPPSREWWER